jgi:hypothetical protein
LNGREGYSSIDKPAGPAMLCSTGTRNGLAGGAAPALVPTKLLQTFVQVLHGSKLKP